MSSKIKKTIHAAFIGMFLICTSVSYAECQKYPAALQTMPQGEDTIINVDGSEVAIHYLIAESASLRAAGFQHVCPETIDKESILFVFQMEFTSAFHMNNVYAPLDIAFFDKQGVIIDIQTMYPYSVISVKKPLYQPAKPAMYALETHQGFFAAAGIKVGARLQSRSVAAKK